MNPGVPPYDLRRESLVRPPDWANPRPAERYDLVVLGAGTAGLVAAAGAAGLGARVALVERGFMGGDCLNFGCVPSKALLVSARRAAEAKRAGRYGVRTAGVEVDFGAVMERMRRIRADLAVHDSASRFRDLGVDVFLGEGRFVGRHAMEVDGNALRFRRALVATGGAPLVPSVPGLMEAGFHTNETVFDLETLPSRLGVVGGGPVGCELAQAFARFGAAVTLVERLDRLLANDEPDAARLVTDALGGEGIRVLAGHDLERVERRGPVSTLFLRGPAGPARVEVDAILVAAGRRPAVDGIGLEAAGIEHDVQAGIRVDDRLRTTNRAVYGAGDVAGRHRFTHMADAEARIVLRNALFPGRRKASTLHVPWCTFTDPEVARVGHSAESAAEAGIAIDSFMRPLSRVDRFVVEGEEAGFVRVHVRQGTDEIVGATVAGAHAGELIGLVALAMRAGAGLGTLADTLFPYPTRSEALRGVADEWQRSRLTPGIRRLLEGWFRLRR
ncbi:MAG TPA: mercuric reductase [Gemmatimonadota bacterium]|nr:mercuric reductase [Gemmatimonadota bacterium]